MTRRFLAVACFRPADAQFRGMERLVSAQGWPAGSGAVHWNGRPLRLDGRKGLETLVLLGHGAEDGARIGDGGKRFLSPDRISLPRDARLYLIGCSQGRRDRAAEWARGAGIPEDRVSGSEGESESLLSTLLLAAVRLRGPDGWEGAFRAWLLLNDRARPWFAEARSLYAASGGNPGPVLSFYAERIDLAPFHEFLAPLAEEPQYFTGLL